MDFPAPTPTTLTEALDEIKQLRKQVKQLREEVRQKTKPDLDADCVAQLLRAVDNVTLARCALVCVEWWKVARATLGYTRATLTGHSSGVRSVAFSPNGETLASSSFDETIRLWNAAHGTPTIE